jgi:hypothetical protein
VVSVAALSCLLLALAGRSWLGLLWPAGLCGLARLVHLHLNTLGFIGLTAIGTLHVLMPTVLGQPDPLVAQRLQPPVAVDALGGVGAERPCRRGLPWLTLPGSAC